MTSMIPLGKFEQVDLKQAWPTEDGNFTPWLALPESISLLGEAMDMELEIEAVEHWVGAFKADILARAVGETDHRVIIENQFGRTNHGHLGQILTYLAGIEDAKTVVWIAESIQEAFLSACRCSRCVPQTLEARRCEQQTGYHEESAEPERTPRHPTCRLDRG